MIERVRTGIDGLDRLIEGGIPKYSAVTVTGGTGCGKTIMAMQFIWEGIKNGEKAKFISLEQQPDAIKEDALTFGWDFYKAEKKGNLSVVYIPPYGERNFVDIVINQLMDEKVDRFVLDPVSTILGYYENNRYNMRNFYYRFINRIKEIKTTALLVTEVPESKSKNSLSRYDIEEFVVDGVIVLYYTGMEGGAFRSLEVRKMRQTNHTPGTFPFKIEKGTGIVVLDRKI